ncbi:MAG TPA: glycosyltransferase family 4 protein [Candidatus Angelobacter sp.]|nr:glycosyltransferase family 4 protein [Candidatus Angelobacter sp.]
MRLLYLVDHWPGLFEAYLLREIQWMRQRGHSVAVLSLGSGGPHGFRDETKDHVDLAEFGLDDIPVLQLDARHVSTEQLIRESLLFVRERQVELIDAHLAREPAEIACRLHRVSGVPFAVRMRGGDVHSNTSPMLAEILHYASAICPMSQFLADVLIGNRILKKMPQNLPANIRPSKLHVIPNSLPVKYLSRAPVPQRDDVQIVGAIGRAVPIKRFPDLVEAVAGLANDFPRLRLLIIGGGVMVPELQALAVKLGLGERFEITGFRSWNEVMSLARQLHIYVQCSELEGCSLATIEAAFQGVPLVLSRTGANEQCVEPGVNGHLFDSGDVPALRESLRSLLSAGIARREQMGEASLGIVGRRFSAENVMPGIEAVFQAAITGQLLLASRVTGATSHSEGMLQ